MNAPNVSAVTMLAFAFVPLQAASYANISSADTGRASAIYSTQRQVAAALGVAVLATVLVERTAQLNQGVQNPAALAQGALGGFQLAFFAATVLIGLAAISATLIRDQDAASTIRRLAVTPTPPHGDEALLPRP